MFENLVQALRQTPRRLVYTEGTEPRILEAVARLKAEKILVPVLIGPEAQVHAAAAAGGYDIDGVEIYDPAVYPEMDELAGQMYELRKGKLTLQECRQTLMQSNYFGVMLVKAGVVDALLGGATWKIRRAKPAVRALRLHTLPPV